MCARVAFSGSGPFYAWMTFLSAVALVGLNAYGTQLNEGMVVTDMSDHVSWGLYIANFTFGVGLAAGAVMMVIPAYLYDDHEMHDVVIVGELVAIAAILMCLCFVTVDLGRPDRFWHMLPVVGRFNWPISMLSWDVIVLNGYLLLNLHVTGYLLYMRYLGRRPNPRWYVPFVFLSIGWAVSIHTVTAFLYSGLGGRPFWNSAILAPRFIMSAFVSGPAFIIILLHVLQRTSAFRVPDGPIRTLTAVLKVTVSGNLFLLASEVFTHFYTGGHHGLASTYLFLGLHGHTALVPWIWTSVLLNIAATVLLLFGLGKTPVRGRLLLACAMVFCGVWIEKGMGLIIPGFIPSTLGEIIEYRPTLREWQVTAGIWAVGFGVLTVLLRITGHVFTKGRSSFPPPASSAPPADPPFDGAPT
jgi:molybdopterin-containing oxidoreductase family membrane subunit